MVGCRCHSCARLVDGLIGRSAELVLHARGLVNAEWRESLAERCGCGNWNNISNFVDPNCIWFHAASVGEIGGLIPVIKFLDSIENDNCNFSNRLITTTSLTGQAEVVRHKLAKFSALFPLDSPNIVRVLVPRVAPSLCVIAETEIWPNFLFTLADCNVPVVYINGRISDSSYSSYKRAKWLLAPALATVSQFLVQTELDAMRFINLGVQEDKIQVGGNTKYDKQQTIYSERDLDEFSMELGIDLNRPVFVAGSVRPKEDKQVVQAFKLACDDIKDLQLIIAPRHPEEFDNVARIITDNGFAIHRRSSGPANGYSKVVLLDTIGELSKVYALAWCAFVGGSFVDIGGHNPLEPASYAKPVIMGSSIWGVRSVVEDLMKANGLYSVANEQELTQTIILLCSNAQVRINAGARAQQVWRSYQGGTKKVVELLHKSLN